MLTPGVAGATAMMITNALGNNFSMSRAWTALALSFLFGFLSVVADKPLSTKILFYFLNSLVIFCVASGANNIGLKTQGVALFDEAFAQVTPSRDEIISCADLYSQISSVLVQINNLKSLPITDENSQNLIGLYAQYALLTDKGKSIPGCHAPENANSSIDRNQIVGGPNSVINNPSQLNHDFNGIAKNPAQILKNGFFEVW